MSNFPAYVYNPDTYVPPWEDYDHRPYQMLPPEVREARIKRSFERAAFTDSVKTIDSV